MLIPEYYETLGLPVNSSLEEIKKAYRKKARLYHPDINHLPEAKEMFIRVTEAYDFLIANHEKGQLGDEDYFRIVEEWRKYRQDRSRQRAQYYARSSYVRFKNSKYYRSTKILNATSVTVLVFTILGYILRLRNPVPGTEKTTLFSFIILMTISIILLSVSFISLKAYIDTNKKASKKK
jgi:hypothetical protein